MHNTANISVSLPVKTLRAVRRYARTHDTTVSRAVQDSLASFLRIYEEKELDRMFAEYYADPRNFKDDDLTAEDVFRASAWYEEVHGRKRATKR